MQPPTTGSIAAANDQKDKQNTSTVGVYESVAVSLT